MVKIHKHGSTLKQVAYARRVFGAKGESRRDIALDVGYSTSIANKVVEKIENTRGFNNAMLVLAKESNNLALAAMAEFKARGFKDFSNKDLVGALNAIGGAWSRFNAPLKEGNGKQDGNKLRAIVVHQAEKEMNEEPVATYEEKEGEEVKDEYGF